MSIFQQIADFINKNYVGVFISLFFGLEAFFRSKIEKQKEATIKQYIEWVRRGENRELLKGHEAIIALLETNDKNAEILENYLEQIIFKAVKSQSGSLSEIHQLASQIPDISQKIDFIIKELTIDKSPAVPRERLLMSPKVLDIIAGGIKGAGYKVLSLKEDTSDVGTLSFLWLLGTKSPNLMLADYVGCIKQNRISLILNDDASITLRAFDGSRNEHSIRSQSFCNVEFVQIFASWENARLSLWINGSIIGELQMNERFGFLGPVLLFGIDIEEKLSADGVRWAPKVEMPGLNFQKDGIWHGSRFDGCMLHSRLLSNEEKLLLTNDPFALFRRNNRNIDDEIKHATYEIQQDSTNLCLYIYRGDVWCDKGDYEKAIRDYNQAIKINPQSVEAYISRGDLFVKLKRYEEANVDYSVAIKLNHRSSYAHNARGLLLSTCPDKNHRNGKQALEDALHAVELSCGMRETLGTLAAAYAETGDFEKAIEIQLKAIEVASEEDKPEHLKRLELYRSGRPRRVVPT